MESEAAPHPGIEYRSAWKRRLALVAAGLALILISKAWYVHLCWREATKPPDAHRSSAAFMAVLRPEATSLTLPCIEQLEPERRREVLVLLPEDNATLFRPIYPDPKDPYRWVDLDMHRPIPVEFLDFTPSKIEAAYKRTKPEHILAHGFTDMLRMNRWMTKKDGDFVELGREHDNAMGPYTRNLTIYAERNGAPEPVFWSHDQIMAWTVITRDDPRALLVNYTHGFESYRWEKGKFVADNTIKKQYLREFLNLCWVGSQMVNGWTVNYLFLLVLLLWIYRAIKFLVLWIFRKPYRPSKVMRAAALGCLTPMLLFFWLMGGLVISEYFEGLVWTARVDLAGWILIGIAAALPNRKISHET